MNAGRILATLALLAGATTVASAQNTQVVSFQVNAVNQIAFSGSPSLTINTATAGSDLTAATATANWAVTTNQTGAKISASLDSDMPSGLVLTVDLTAPATASSAGVKTLSSASVDLVTGITKLAAGSLGVGYSLTASASAGVVSSTTRTVTYTITGGT